MGLRGGRRSLTLCLAFAFLIVAFVPVHAKEGEGPSLVEVLEEVGIEAVKPSPQAAAFALSTLEGKKAALSDLRGQMVLLHFWATWSPPARFEIESLSRLQKAMAEQPLTVLSVATDVMGKSTVEAFVEELATGVPVLLDPSGETLKRYAVRVIPTTILIDGDGQIVGRAVGARQWDGQQMVDALKKLLKSPGHYGIIAKGHIASRKLQRSR